MATWKKRAQASNVFRVVNKLNASDDDATSESQDDILEDQHGQLKNTYWQPVQIEFPYAKYEFMVSALCTLKFLQKAPMHTTQQAVAAVKMTADEGVYHHFRVLVGEKLQEMRQKLNRTANWLKSTGDHAKQFLIFEGQCQCQDPSSS